MPALPVSLPSPAVGDMLSCGHVLTPPVSIGTGYATFLADTPDSPSRTLCYPCADTEEAKRMSDAAVYVVYVRPDASAVTTWTGGVLGRITSHSLTRTRYTPTGGAYRTRSITVTTPDGTKWRGRGSANYEAVMLRRV